MSGKKFRQRWGTVASNIPFRSLGKSFVTQARVNVLGKCGVQGSVPVVENHSDGYPENIQLFRSTFDV